MGGPCTFTQLGIERGIIVQTTTYGADHQVVLDGLKAMGPNYRGCANAIVFVERDDAYLARAPPGRHQRRALQLSQGTGRGAHARHFRSGIARLRELGWYMKIQPEKNGIVSSAEKYQDLDVPVLIDHMARIDPEAATPIPACASCSSS